jgi:hypothetical protein
MLSNGISRGNIPSVRTKTNTPNIDTPVFTRQTGRKKRSKGK